MSDNAPTPAPAPRAPSAVELTGALVSVLSLVVEIHPVMKQVSVPAGQGDRSQGRARRSRPPSAPTRPSSKHVPSGDFVVKLNPAGRVNVPAGSNDDALARNRELAEALTAEMQKVLAPMISKLGEEAAALIDSASSARDAEHARGFAKTREDLQLFHAYAVTPTDSAPYVSLNGQATVTGDRAEARAKEIAIALDGVLTVLRTRRQSELKAQVRAALVPKAEA